MTQRLYYDDAYTVEFDAIVVEAVTANGHPAAILDNTFFYPTSGGQPHDTGWLGESRVVDVQAEDNGQVLHILDGPLSPGPVHGVIDWDRRFDHMQQHSGQHLLSQAFYTLFQLETVSVHFGETTSTLDLDAAALTSRQLAQVETYAADLVYANRPIRHYWVQENDLARIPLRRPPQVSGRIRIVEIADFDWSACGGTHVRHTGEIGPVKLLRVERVRNQSRVHFVCGKRALADYRQKHDLINQAAAVLDTHIEQVPALIDKQQTHIKELEREVRALQEKQLAYRARELLAAARRVANVCLVAQPCPDLTPAMLKGLAQALLQEEGVVALLSCESGDRATVLFARSAGVALDVSQLLRTVLSQFGGGGGGRPDFAQGGGPPAEQMEEILAAAVGRVVNELGAPASAEEGKRAAK